MTLIAPLQDTVVRVLDNGGVAAIAAAERTGGGRGRGAKKGAVRELLEAHKEVSFLLFIWLDCMRNDRANAYL